MTGEFAHHHSVNRTLLTVTLVWPISVCVPNLMKISSLATDYGQKSKFKMTATSILNFNKSIILGPSDPCMVNIYLQTKSGANRSRNCWHTSVYVFPRWRPSAILDLFYTNFGLSQCCPWWAKFFLLMALWYVQMQLRYCNFSTSWIWLKNTYWGQFLSSFWGFWPLNLWCHRFTPRRYAVSLETCIMRYWSLKLVHGCVL